MISSLIEALQRVSYLLNFFFQSADSVEIATVVQYLKAPVRIWKLSGRMWRASGAQ